MIYRASLDVLAKVITISSTLLLISLSTISIRALMIANGDISEIALHSITLLFFFGIPLFSFLLSPKNYLVETDAIVIDRALGAIRIPFEHIKSFGKPEVSDMAGTLRVFGVGGIFGYMGRFRNPKFGNMIFYATQRKNWVLIETDDNKKFIITPNEIEKMVQDLREKTGI